MAQYPKLLKSRPDLFPRRHGRGAELEVCDLLYGLIRIVKPKLVVETGTFVADSAERIAQALVANGFGHLHTCDVNIQPEAQQRLAHLPATIHHSRGINIIHHFQQMDFVFIDSGSPDDRYEELTALGRWNIPPLGIVCWHDACVEMHRNMYEYFSLYSKWPHLMFPTEVGFVAFQRPEDDLDTDTNQMPPLTANTVC